MNGGPRGSSAEVQDVGKLFLVKFAHHRPEPDDNLVVGSIRLLVYRVLPPVLQVNEGDAV